MPTSGVPSSDGGRPAGQPLWEVFVRSKRGLNHVHVGSLHAADDQMALRHARDASHGRPFQNARLTVPGAPA